MGVEKIAIYGAGGLGREVACLIDDINRSNPLYEFIGYFDDGKSKGEIINSFPVLGGIHELNNYNSAIAVVIAVGHPQTRRKIVASIVNKNITFPTVIHPSVLRGPSEFTTIGEGCIICAGVMITVNIDIRDFVMLNLSCTVGHDTLIESYCSVMPTVNISGGVKVRSEVYLGTGAKITNQLDIGKGTIVGAGAVVTHSLPENCTAVGVPAKPIKYHV